MDDLKKVMLLIPDKFTLRFFVKIIILYALKFFNKPKQRILCFIKRIILLNKLNSFKFIKFLIYTQIYNNKLVFSFVKISKWM